MEDKKMIKGFIVISMVVTLVTLLLSIVYNSAFIPSFMLMLSLSLFGISYYIKDIKKSMMYLLFVVGVLLIIGSLVYTFIRLS